MHNTVTYYMETRPIMDMFEAVERNRWPQVGIRWWEQAGLDLERAR